jgi:RNA polymerase sigma-70 factor (sigma-E family)
VEGDAARFADFVAQRLSPLYRYAVVLTSSSQDAEDLVQEALTRTALAWRRVRAQDPERYVRTTMVRIMANRWRRPRREYPVADVPDRGAEDERLNRLDESAGLTLALANLPPRMRAVLVLRYVDRMTEAEIADVLGCSRGTVKSQASRALAKLRVALQPQEE